MTTDSAYITAGVPSASMIRQRASLDHLLGPEIADELGNPRVTDIHVNEDGIIRVVDRDYDGRIAGQLPPESVESVIRLLASHMGTIVTADRPTVSGVLPGTAVRFQGILPPVSDRPVLALRKASEVIYTLDHCVQDGVLSPSAAEVIRNAIITRENLLITGGTGAGKTTLASSCLAEPAFTKDRMIIIEDTRELQCSAHDCVRLLAPPGLKSITMNDLVRTTLRLFPTRIVVGEVRGPEALSMIKAWGTGHPGGLCTLHANGPVHGNRQGLSGLRPQGAPSPQVSRWATRQT